MDELKYCVNCAHYFPKTSVDCRAPENMTPSLVTGEPVVVWQAVVSRAMPETGCGAQAKWFKPRDKEAA